MRPRPFLLLIAGFVLVQMAGEADAKEPEWSYTLGEGNGWYPSGVHSVAISADGEYIVASSTNKVYLFDKDNGTPLWNYTTDSWRDKVRTIAISADGEYITAGTGYSRDDPGDCTVYLFDKDSSTPLWSYTIEDCEYTVHSVAISADGEYLSAGSDDNKVYLFGKDSSTPLWSYDTGSNVRSVSISADGEYIAAGSSGSNVYLFDKDSSTPLWNYTTGSYVYSVAISVDGKYIAAGSNDHKVYLFDKDSSTPIWSYTTGSYVDSVAISADGEYIVAGSDKIYLFDKDSSTPIWTSTVGSVVAISADGEYITAGSNDDKVYLFDKDNSTPLWSYDVETYTKPTVAISADGEYIVVGTNNKVYLSNKTVPVSVEKSSGDDDDDDDDESFFPVQVGTLVVLGLIYRLRRDTSSSDGLNKMLRIGLYGMAILLFLIAVIMGALSSARTSTYVNGEVVQDDEYLVSDSGDRKIWVWWMAYAILFALTGSFLGDETNNAGSFLSSRSLFTELSGPSYRSSSTSSLPTSKPIFANRRATPMFAPENELTAIECPGCNARMEVPKLGTMQKVTCDSCGLSGEIEV